MFLLKVLRSFCDSKIEFAVCGGQALALHGAVRGTVDVDLVLRLSENNLKRASETLESLGLRSRLPISYSDVFHFRKEYIEKRHLIAWSFVNPSRASEVVDLIISEDLKNMHLTHKNLAGIKVPLLSIPDLIKMKKAAGRLQDLADVEALKLLQKAQKK